MFEYPRIFGHRGAAGFAPENTLASISAAKRCKVPLWVEFDVKLSQDGVLILMHDDTVDRTTNGNGLVKEHDFDTLRSLSAGAWFDPEFKDEKIPTLEEAFKLLSTLNLGANIEIKPCPGREIQTAQALAHFVQNHYPKNCPGPLISSFDMSCLECVRAVSNDFKLGLLFEDCPNDWLLWAQKLKPETINIWDEKVNKNIVSEISKHGYAVLVYTVNSVVRAEELFSWGVKGVFTDYPAIYARALPNEDAV